MRPLRSMIVACTKFVPIIRRCVMDRQLDESGSFRQPIKEGERTCQSKLGSSKYQSLNVSCVQCSNLPTKNLCQIRSSRPVDRWLRSLSSSLKLKELGAQLKQPRLLEFNSLTIRAPRACARLMCISSSIHRQHFGSLLERDETVPRK
jgi:hypothetical protein